MNCATDSETPNLAFAERNRGDDTNNGGEALKGDRIDDPGRFGQKVDDVERIHRRRTQTTGVREHTQPHRDLGEVRVDHRPPSAELLHIRTGLQGEQQAR